MTQITVNCIKEWTLLTFIKTFFGILLQNISRRSRNFGSKISHRKNIFLSTSQIKLHYYYYKESSGNRLYVVVLIYILFFYISLLHIPWHYPFNVNLLEYISCHIFCAFCFDANTKSLVYFITCAICKKKKCYHYPQRIISLHKDYYIEHNLPLLTMRIVYLFIDRKSSCVSKRKRSNVCWIKDRYIFRM